MKDKIIIGAAGGDRGVRDFIVALDAATGKLVWRKYVIPAPGEPGSETWKDKNNAWQTGGGAMWVTGSYDVATNQVLWGTGNPVPMFDPYYRPGDNLYTNSLISWDPDTGKMNWYHQYTPGDMWDYDEAGTHILIDGADRRPAAQAGDAFGAQRLPLHVRAHQRADACWPSPIWTRSTGPSGIDQKTGNAGRLRSQPRHPGLFRPAEPDADGPHQEAVPVHGRRQQLSGRRPTARAPS